MQPKFTLKQSGRFVSKFIALALVFFLSAQYSDAQESSRAKDTKSVKQEKVKATVKSDVKVKTTEVSKQNSSASADTKAKYLDRGAKDAKKAKVATAEEEKAKLEKDKKMMSEKASPNPSKEEIEKSKSN